MINDIKFDSFGAGVYLGMYASLTTAKGAA